MPMYGILLSRLGWCPQLLLGIVRQATKTDMQDCWSFTCCFSGRCSSELAQLVPLPFSQGKSTCYSDRLHYFSVTIPRCYKDVYVNSFFPRMAKHWNSLPIECFPLTYDLSGFKPKQTSFNCTFFLNRFSVSCISVFCISVWLFSLAWSESQLLKKNKSGGFNSPFHMQSGVNHV